jgi:hypothetical protein
MKNFVEFLKEEAEESKQLKHITHPEDRPFAVVLQREN